MNIVPRSMNRAAVVATFAFAVRVPAASQTRPTIGNPNDSHETLLHRWLYTFGRMRDFLRRFLWNWNAATGAGE